MSDSTPVHEMPVLREEVIVPGQLTKKVLREGTDDEGSPTPGSDVTVHYTGRLLDGTVFDSSHKRNDPFKFKIGQGQVIKGWDEGVATMKVGEKCLLRCEPDYAYGASGSPPTIPPNATLEFEVDLLSWTDEEPVDNTNGCVTKRVKRAGTGWTTPEDSTTVTIKYSAKVLPNGPEFHAMGDEEKYLIGEDPAAVRGFEEALKSMKQGEHAVFTVKPEYGYGAKGDEKQGVPANAKLQFDVELLSMEKAKDTYDMDFDEKLAHMTKLKELGNKFFKAGQVSRAIQKYSDAVRVFEFESDMNDEQREMMQPVKVVCLQNQAICEYKEKNYTRCIEKCDAALKMDSKNIKCLFKRGQSNFQLDNLSEAERDLKAAWDLDSNNNEVKRELMAVRRKRKELVELEKKRFGGFFDKIRMYTDEEIEKEKAAAAKEKAAAYGMDDSDSGEGEFSEDVKPSPMPTEPVANPPLPVDKDEPIEDAPKENGTEDVTMKA